MSRIPSRNEFFAHLNEKFLVYFDQQTPTEVELVEVSEVKSRGAYVSFSLVFIAPQTIFPAQTLARVEHRALGAFELLLVPFEENAAGLAFEAVFNRLAEGSGD